MKNSFFYNNFFTELEERVIFDEEKNLEKISIVMPGYNQVDFIERSILSVLNQNYPNIDQNLYWLKF